MDRPPSPHISSAVVVAELIEVGAQEAARAIALLLRRPSVPVGDVAFIASAQLADRHGGRVVVVSFTVSGGMPGRFIVLTSESNARTLAADLVGPVTGDPFPDRALGAFTELGNIAASAYLNGVARAVDTACVPSVPLLVLDDAMKAIEATLGASEAIAVARLDIGDVHLDLAMLRS